MTLRYGNLIKEQMFVKNRENGEIIMKSGLSFISVAKYVLFNKIDIRDALVLSTNLNVPVTHVLTHKTTIIKYLIPFGKYSYSKVIN